MGYRTFIREQIALGKMPYMDKVNLIGLNAAITTSAETVSTPSSTYAQLTTAVAIEAVSGSANDTSSGTGARTIRVTYLDSNYKTVSADVTMNGATPVAIGTAMAVNSAYVLTAGSGLVNAGAIDIRAVSGGAIKRQIAASAGRSQDFIYTIPAGYVGLMCPIHMTASGVTGTFIGQLLTKDSSGIIRIESRVDVGISNTSITPVNVVMDLGTGLLVPEKTLIELQATTSTGAGIVSATGELLIIDSKNNGVI